MKLLSLLAIAVSAASSYATSPVQTVIPDQDYTYSCSIELTESTVASRNRWRECGYKQTFEIRRDQLRPQGMPGHFMESKNGTWEEFSPINYTDADGKLAATCAKLPLYPKDQSVNISFVASKRNPNQQGRILAYNMAVSTSSKISSARGISTYTSFAFPPEQVYVQTSESLRRNGGTFALSCRPK